MTLSKDGPPDRPPPGPETDIYRAMLDGAADGVALARGGIIIYANARLSAILGRPLDAIIGAAYTDLIDAGTLAMLREVEDGGDARYDGVSPRRTEIARLDGSKTHVELTFSRIARSDGDVYVTFVRDVSCREDSARRLKESELKYRVLFESANDAIFTMRADRFIDCNTKTLEMFQCTREQIIGEPPYRFSPSHQADGRDSMTAALEHINAALAGEPQFFEWLHSRMNGAVFDAEVSLNRVIINDEVFLQALVRDVSRRKRTEQALRESEWLYRTLLANLPVGVALTTPDGEIFTYNDTAARILGYTDGVPIELRVSDLYVERSGRNALLARLLEGEEIHDHETAMIRRDGSRVPVKLHIVPYFLQGQHVLLSVLEDLTAQKRSEEENRAIADKMRQAQKLESLGVLAGGIAHDFNNLLMGITGNADMALVNADDRARWSKHIRGIQQAAFRAADLAKQMLAYSGRGRFVVETIDLNALVLEMHNLLSASISKSASIELRLRDEPLFIDADATQIRQIIMNLIVNASEAIGDSDGVITVSTGAMECDAARLAQYHLDDNLPPGGYVSLRVDDDGVGMDPDTLEKIFDPFFTTKFTGRGLGLAAVLGIVRGHRGAIAVKSYPSKGSSFEILLPSSAKPPSAPPPVRAPEARLPKLSGTVLVVDDEEAVRSTTAGLLSSLGYDVLTANDGKEGVDVFARHKEEIVLVLLDLMMPRMTGEKAYHEIRRIARNVRIILMSGYSEQEVTGRFGAGDRPDEILQKPFGMSQLLALIR